MSGFATLGAIFGVLIFFWLIAVRVDRDRRRKSIPPIPIYDSGPLKIKNQSWSPTRGHYRFKVSDLPAVYRELPELGSNADNATIVEFAESEEHAVANLRRRLGYKLLGEDIAPAPLDGLKAVDFRPLNRRKMDRA